MNVSIVPGVLYIVATPIGNLEDMSPRAVRILREVSLVAAEDTRHSKRLLKHFGIGTALISLHEHNEQARISRLLAELQLGKSIALISDAGTPLISDPGFQLVRCVRAAGLQLVPVPGPSSLTAALSVAGLPTDRFVFEGFLPAKTGMRLRRLEALAQEDRTLVFFESSHRIQASLGAMAMVFGGERPAVLARELTKLFEEIQNDTLDGLQAWVAAADNRQKGEFIVLVQGAPATVEPSMTAETHRLLAALLEELPIKRAVTVAVKLTGMKKNILYDMALSVKENR